jgi:AcrR family transcriptional regulator
MDKKHKKLDAYDRILDAAAHNFSQVGYAGARMEEIAKQAGVNKASIYYHVGDKKALYQEVLSKVISVTADRIAENMKSVSSPSEKLAVYIRTMTRRVDDNPHVPRMMMREVADGGQNFPEAIIQDLIRILNLLAEILEDGVDQGVFTEAPPFLVHLMIMGSYAFFKSSLQLVEQVGANMVDRDRIFKNSHADAAAEIEKLLINAMQKPTADTGDDHESH